MHVGTLRVVVEWLLVLRVDWTTAVEALVTGAADETGGRQGSDETVAPVLLSKRNICKFLL